jgi:polyribonucleotide nucleotidyltransferase
MKVVDQETGEDLTEKLKAQRDAEKAQRDQQREAGE